MLRYLAIALTVVFFNTPPSFGDTCNDSGLSLALHVGPADSEIECWSGGLNCSSPIVSWGELGQEYKVYLVLLDWSIETSLKELQIGVDYDSTLGSGVDVLDFQACPWITTTPIGDWPEPGSELRMTLAGCIRSEAAMEGLVLGWFRVIGHTRGDLSLVHSPWPLQPGTVPRHVTCDLVEKLLDPLNQGAISLGGGFGWNRCLGVADGFEGPCCLPNSTCQEATTVGCCWAQGGRRLDYLSTCAQCFTPALPKTWGQLKSRYE